MADFIDKTTGSADKGIKAVSSEGRELLETIRLKGKIKDVEGRSRTDPMFAANLRWQYESGA